MAEQQIPDPHHLRQSIMPPEAIRSSDDPGIELHREDIDASIFKSMASGDERTDSSPKRYAVFIAHGMGQQVPFETMDAATRGLRRVAPDLPEIASIGETVRTRTVRIGTQTHERVEFDLKVTTDPTSPPEDVEVHVYESYWAPFTEGEVKLWDVMSFLIQGFWGGIRNSFKPLKRWMFEQETPLEKNRKTSFYFLVTGLILLSLVVLNALTGVIVLVRLLRNEEGAWPQDSLLIALTFIASILCLTFFLYGIALWLMMAFKKSQTTGELNKVYRKISALLWVGFWVCCGVIILSSIGFGLLAVLGHFKLGAVDKLVAELPSSWQELFGSKIIWIIVWGALYLTAYLTKRLLVQYPGDVAAYVSSYKLDRFSEIRKKIKSTTLNVLETIYTATEGGKPYYDRIGIMGHSLGSVVAYDALNTVINKDRLNNGRDQVVDRTKVFITFGSPLDKTAYIFSLFGKDTTSIREKLATSKQPLIQDYDKYRSFKWINVFSKRDIVSGSLDYYDCEKASGYSSVRKVDNREDPTAIIPLVAHVEYWENSIVFEEFLKELI